MLADRGALYELEGDVYFLRSADAAFGSVSRLDAEQMIKLSAERGGDPGRPGKKDALDPLVWLARRPGEPVLGLQVRSGPARLARGVRGDRDPVPRHRLRRAGGRLRPDLPAPRDERLACQGGAGRAGGEAFARRYAHAGMVRLGGEKMSKSLGNLVFVSVLRLSGTDPMAIRLAILAHHYRTDWDWTDEGLTAASRRLDRWRAAVRAGSGGQGGVTAGPVPRSSRGPRPRPGGQRREGTGGHPRAARGRPGRSWRAGVRRRVGRRDAGGVRLRADEGPSRRRRRGSSGTPSTRCSVSSCSTSEPRRRSGGSGGQASHGRLWRRPRLFTAPIPCRWPRAGRRRQPGHMTDSQPRDSHDPTPPTRTPLTRTADSTADPPLTRTPLTRTAAEPHVTARTPDPHGTDPRTTGLRCRVRVGSADGILAVVPHLLGFHPTDSLVMLGIGGPHARIRLAFRYDLPDPPEDGLAADIAAHAATVLRRQHLTMAIAVGYGLGRTVTPVVDVVAPALREAGIAVQDVLRVEGGRYWSYLCGDPACCPPDGVPFDSAGHPASAALAAAGLHGARRPGGAGRDGRAGCRGCPADARGDRAGAAEGGPADRPGRRSPRAVTRCCR